MINLYTAKSFITESNRRFIFPLMLDIFFIPNSDINQKYTIVENLEEADIAVLPLDIGNLYTKKQHQFVHNFIADAMKLNKIIWVYSANDLGLTVNFNYDSLYVFRLGGKNSKMNPNNWVLPSFISDPYGLKYKGEFRTVPKTEKPSIGFVGHATAGIKKFMSEYYIYAKYNLQRVFRQVYSDYFSLYLAGIKRYHLLKMLATSDKLNSDFILRKKYRAGQLDKEKTTQEYFQNLFANSYTFCFRGGGNFSVRFYETLAMGRIPILVNTDCRLPLTDIIDWEKHCVIVDFDKKSELIDRIVDFHKNCSDSAFVAMQENNRSLWLDYLKRESYFLKIHDIFTVKLRNHG